MKPFAHAIFAALFLTPASPFFAGSARAAAEDVVFKALEDELKRSLTLHLEDLDKPYFIQYGVDDGVTYRLSAEYGALTRSDRNQTRVLHSQVRLGSYDLDNSNFAGARGGGRLGSVTELPSDDNYLALRQAIWHATDHQFKDAVETLSQKRAYLKERNAEERAPDFTRAAPATEVADLATLRFESTVWEDYVRRISARFRDFPRIDGAEVLLLAGAENHYLVNSEGARLRHGEVEALLRITVEAQADDGEHLSDQLSYFATAPEKLPPVAEILTAVQGLADRLAAASRAPILQEYSGPVLFDGQAATQLFRQLLVRGVTGQPDPVGAARRNAVGADEAENRIGKRLLPQTFTIYDDPRAPKFEDTFLAGHYRHDDEGVEAQRVNLVVQGKLEGMVMSRAPTKQFAASNGHGRRGGGDLPRSSIGCLYVESSKGMTPEALKQELLRATEAEGLKFGLRIEGIQSRSSGPGGGPGSFGRGAVRGSPRLVGDPLYVSKVFPDGHEELVRGCEFSALDVQSLRRIIAAGSARTVQNNVIGNTPSSSVIAPAILIAEVELARNKGEVEKRPLLAAPHARRAP
jgi:hypothetical protein